MSENLKKATLAGGCFWCTEAVFKRLKGVTSVASGYSGGTVKNPTYDDVCNGKTGHAEAIQITFDPTIISFDKMLDVFWRVHNPTTMNMQENDVGTQYRSAIFYHSDSQKEVAQKSKETIEKEKLYNDPVVTQIVEFTNFYPAEPHHQNYYDRNTDYPYCQFVIDPKIQKLYKDFRQDLKEEYKEQG